MGRRRHKGDKVDGWINLDKPVGLTSTQAIGKVRRILNAGKAGHAGTLDPLACGILPIALGEATKTIPYIQDSLKTYEFTITWGEQRSTDDSEGDIIAQSDVRPSREDIISALPAFIGEIEQIPPQFSAIKIDGQRAYDLARSGEDVDIQARRVFVESLSVCHPDSPALKDLDSSARALQNETCFEMVCGKGTYVRSIARDLGLKLGTYGYISALRRTQVGAFSVNDAISLEKLEEMDHSAARNAALKPVQAVLDDIPALEIKQDEAQALRNGQALSLISKADFERLDGFDKGSEALAVFKEQAIALVIIEGPQVKPVRVFNL